MGYVAPPIPSGVITLPEGASYSAFVAAKEAFRGSNLLVVSHGVKVTLPPYSTPRLWADRHLEQLGYGLLASAGAFVVSVAWLLVGA